MGLRRKILCLIILITAVFSLYAATPVISGAQVSAAANYGSATLEIYARKVASEINRERAAAGLEPVRFCDSINEVALTRARECASEFDHIRPDGTLCFTALDEANVPYYTAGENIACGQNSPQSVMSAWMNSQEHRANILSSDFEYVGVGVCYIGGVYYWTQFFTGGLPVEGEVVPFISKQPKNVKTSVSSNVRFEVTVNGSGLSYQWYYKKKDASGWSIWKNHTTANTSGTANDSWNGMQVQCRITDSMGMTLISDPAEITIVDGPVITSQPKNISISPGAVATFEIAATGKSLSYQWYFRKADASGWSRWNSHTSSVTSGTVNESWNGMQVFCRVTDSNGISVDSLPAAVTLRQTVFITSQPADVTTSSGLETKFEIKASGNGLNYQWYYKKAGSSNWSIWKNHTDPVLIVYANDTWNGMRVYCRVTDSTGAFVNSDSAVVTLVQRVKIKRNPDDVYTAPGRSVSFTVIASGKDLIYQWYYKKSGSSDWLILNKYTKPTLTLMANDDRNGMQVRCMVTDFGGMSVYSLPASIIFNDGIVVKYGPSNVVAKAGQKIAFFAEATGEELSCQWYYKKSGASGWSLWKGHVTPKTSAVSNESWDGMKVFCLFTDKYGGTASSGCATVYIVTE